jgi:hypothetical protein
MKAEFKAMQEALMRLFESFIAENASAYPQWEMECSPTGPGIPNDWNVVQSAYEVHFRLSCRRPCCQGADADELFHRLWCLAAIHPPNPRRQNPTGVAVFSADLWGLVDVDEDLEPNFSIENPTIDSVLEAGARLLAHVPELHRILEADTLDWRTRFEMRRY